MPHPYKPEEVLCFATHLGEVMLKSGAETYRVEDTIMRILSSHDFEKADIFVTPTGIMATVRDTSFSPCSIICRVKDRSTRLDRVEEINQLSRDYVDGKISIQEASKWLKEIEALPPYSPPIMLYVTGVCCIFICLMFGGGPREAFASFFIGLLVAQMLFFLRQKKLVNFFILFVTSLCVGTIASIASILFKGDLNTESMIIAGIMPLVPGVSFTNAIRDAIGDELLAGISRGVEALLIAIAIAAGIGVSMGIGFSIGGIS
jgi:uncharacterized membrane protein YjjP (DUF1212 family)